MNIGRWFLLFAIALSPLLLASCASELEDRSDARSTRVEHRKNRQEQRRKAFEPLRPDEEYRVLPQ